VSAKVQHSDQGARLFAACAAADVQRTPWAVACRAATHDQIPASTGGPGSPGHERPAGPNVTAMQTAPLRVTLRPYTSPVVTRPAAVVVRVTFGPVALAVDGSAARSQRAPTGHRTPSAPGHRSSSCTPTEGQPSKRPTRSAHYVAPLTLAPHPSPTPTAATPSVPNRTDPPHATVQISPQASHPPGVLRHPPLGAGCQRFGSFTGSSRPAPAGPTRPGSRSPAAG
jgi:hypothetical protein